MSNRVRQQVTRAEVVAVIAEMLEDAFSDYDDVWYSVEIKSQIQHLVTMTIRTKIGGKDAKLSWIFDNSEMAHVDCVRISVDDAIRAVIRCKADPSLIGE